MTGNLLDFDSQDLPDAMGRINHEIALLEAGILVDILHYALLRLIDHDLTSEPSRRPPVDNLRVGGPVASPRCRRSGQPTSEPHSSQTPRPDPSRIQTGKTLFVGLGG